MAVSALPLVISVFPQHMRATLSSAFMAGGLFGQVLGVALGGQIAASHGWRVAFLAIGLFGLVLAVLFPLVVREKRIAALGAVAGANGTARHRAAPPLGSLFASRTVVLAYVGSGLQLFCAGALPAWLPTFLGRYYAMPVDRAGRTAAVLFLICGAGMILCGMASDRLSREPARRKIMLAVGYCLGSAAALFLAMQCAPGIGAIGAAGAGHVPGRRNDRTGWRDGGQSHPAGDPWHRLCHADAGEQPAGPCAGSDHHRHGWRTALGSTVAFGLIPLVSLLAALSLRWPAAATWLTSARLRATPAAMNALPGRARAYRAGPGHRRGRGSGGDVPVRTLFRARSCSMPCCWAWRSTS